MATEDIGGVSISVNVDLSDLDAKFQAAVAEAGADGQKIGQAIADGIGQGAETGAAAFQSAMDKLVSEGNSANDAFQKLTGSTQTFVEALQSGALNDFADNFGKITSEAQSAAPALEQVATSAKDASAALQQMTQSGSGGFSLSSMFAGAQEGFQSLTQGLGSLDQATTITMGDMSSLGGSIAALGGIALGVGGLKMLASDMADASDNLNRADIALKALTGDAGSAQSVLQGLDQLGMSDGLSMPGLRQAAISMEALLPAGTDIVGVLSHVADAAAVMGGSIDGVASKFDRMVDSGTLAARSLGSIGLTLDDIGKSMTDLGATADQMSDGVAKAFKNLDSEGRVEVLTEALQKFQGVAEDVAQNTFGGLWQQAANTFEQDMAKMGDSILPFVQDALPSIKEAINETFADVERIKEAFNVVADGIAGVVATIVTAVMGIGSAFSALFQGDWSGAVKAIQDLGAQMSTAWKAAQGQVADDVQAGQDKIAAILNQSSNIQLKLVPDFQAADDQMKAAQDMAAATGATIVDVTGKVDSLAGHFKATGQAAQEAFTSWKTALANTSDEMQVLIKWMDDLLAAHQKVIAAAAASGQTLQQYWQSISDAAERSVQAYNDLAEKAPAAILAVVDPLHTAQQAAKDAQAAFQSIFNIDPAPLNALAQAFKTLGVTTTEAKPDLDALNTALETVLKDTSVGWDDPRIITALNNIDKAAQQVGKSSLVDLSTELGKVTADLISAGAPLDLIYSKMSQWESTIQKLAKTDLPDAIAQQENYIAQLTRMGAGITAIQDATISLDQMQIKLADDAVQAGKAEAGAASDYILNIEKIQLLQQAAKLDAAGWADAIVGAIKGMQQAWDSMSQTIADTIVKGGDWSKAWHTILQTFETDILQGVIKGALEPLEAALLKLIASLLPSVASALGVVGGGIAGLAGQATAAGSAITAMASQMDAAGGAADALSASLDNLALAADNAAAGLGGGLGGGLGDGSGDGSGSSGTGASGSGGGIVGIITGIVQALAAIIGDVYLHAIDVKMFSVETSTNRTANDLANLRADEWSRFGQMYDRLGEIKNDADTMLATLQAMYAGGTGGGGLGKGAQSDLDSIASNSDAMLTAIGKVDLDVQALVQPSVSSANSLSYILADDNNISNNSFIQIARLDSIIAAINYHGQNQDNAVAQVAQSTSRMEMALAGGGPLSPPANLIPPGTGGGPDRPGGKTPIQAPIGQTPEQIAAQDAARLAAAQAQLNASYAIADQIKSLQQIIAQDDALMNDALAKAATEKTQEAANADLALAAQYQQDAANATRQLAPLISATNQGLSQVTTGVTGQILDSSGQVIQAQASGSQFIVTAVDKSAVTISQAVATATAASAAAFSASIAGFTAGLMSVLGAWGGAGGGLGYGQGSGLPSGSGGSTKPTSPYNPNDYLPPGTTIGGPAGSYGGGSLPPLNQGPSLPNPTAPNYGGIPGAYAPATFNQTPPPPASSVIIPPPAGTTFSGPTGYVPNNLPKFDQGGIMPYTGLAHMEQGEMALPPDLSAMLRRMASTPSMAMSFPNPAAGGNVGSPAVGQVIFNVYGGSAAENVRQISQYMKVVSPKLAALSS